MTETESTTTPEPPPYRQPVDAVVADFIAGAVRAFIDSAGDDLWFQLLTLMRKAADPGLVAVQTILTWVVAARES